MSKSENELKIRQRVLQLQAFYKHLLLYAAVVLFCILIWIILNHDYFWPIWIILIGGGYLGMRAVRLGLVPLIEEIFPFIRYQWVEDEIQRRLAKESMKAESIKKTTVKTPLAKESTKAQSIKKTTVKTPPTSSSIKKKSAAPAKKDAVAKKTAKKSSPKK